MALKDSIVERARYLVPRSAIAGEIYSGAMLLLAAARLPRARSTPVLDPLLRAWRVTERPRPVGSAAIRWARRLLRIATQRDGRLLPLAENRLLAEFVASPQADRIRQMFAGAPLEHRLRIRLPHPPEDPERQGDLIVLKRPVAATGEKGVLLAKYSETAEMLAVLYQVERLVQAYTIVLEPSWWGYADVRFLYYVGSDARVLIQSPAERDREFIAALGTNLVAVELGAGDWVDENAFAPAADGSRRWDFVMVSSWSRAKRHDVLFEAMQQLRSRGERVTAALVGYPIDMTIDDIRGQAQARGVLDQCTFFENISHREVNDVVAQSRVSVLLSMQEGANKALYESLFSDTPVLVPKGHLGVNLEHVGAAGDFFEPAELADKLLAYARGSGRQGAREWALANTGARRTSRLLNDMLARMAREAGEPWTTDITPKKNAPGLRYLEPGRYRDFDDAYNDLQQYLR